MMSEKLRLHEQQKLEPTNLNSLELYKNNNEITKESTEALNKNIEHIS